MGEILLFAFLLNRLPTHYKIMLKGSIEPNLKMGIKQVVLTIGHIGGCL